MYEGRTFTPGHLHPLGYAQSKFSQKSKTANTSLHFVGEVDQFVISPYRQFLFSNFNFLFFLTELLKNVNVIAF